MLNDHSRMGKGWISAINISPEGQATIQKMRIDFFKHCSIMKTKVEKFWVIAATQHGDFSPHSHNSLSISSMRTLQPIFIPAPPAQDQAEDLSPQQMPTPVNDDQPLQRDAHHAEETSTASRQPTPTSVSHKPIRTEFPMRIPAREKISRTAGSRRGKHPNPTRRIQERLDE